MPSEYEIDPSRYSQLNLNDPSKLYEAVNALVRNAYNLSRIDLLRDVQRLAVDFETLRRHFVSNPALLDNTDDYNAYRETLRQIAWLESYSGSIFSRMNPTLAWVYFGLAVMVTVALAGGTFLNLAIPPDSDFIGDGSFDCNNDTFAWSIRNIKNDLSLSLNGSLSMLGIASVIGVSLLGFILYRLNINNLIPLQRQNVDSFANSTSRFLSHTLNLVLLLCSIAMGFLAVLSTLAARKLPTMTTTVVESAMTIYEDPARGAYSYEFTDHQAKELVKSLFYSKAPTLSLVICSITAAALMLSIFRTQIVAALSSIVRPCLQCIGIMRSPDNAEGQRITDERTAILAPPNRERALSLVKL